MVPMTFIWWIYHFWARFWPYFNFVDFRAYFGPFSHVNRVKHKNLSPNVNLPSITLKFFLWPHTTQWHEWFKELSSIQKRCNVGHPSWQQMSKNIQKCRQIVILHEWLGKRWTGLVLLISMLDACWYQCWMGKELMKPIQPNLLAWLALV